MPVSGSIQSQILQYSQARESLIDLTQPWQTLFAEAGALPTQDADWVLAAIQADRNSNDLHIVTMEQRVGTGIDAVTPLSTQGIGSVSHLVFLLQANLQVPMDLLCRDIQAMRALLRRMIHLGRPIRLERFNGESILLPTLQAKPPMGAAIRIDPSTACPVFKIEEKWARPEECLHPVCAQDLQRALQGAQEIGDIRPVVVFPKPHHVVELLGLAFRIDALSEASKARTGIMHDPVLASFFMRYAALASAHGRLVMLLLHLGTQPVAMQLAVEYANRLWIIRSSYDQRFTHCAPDQILLRHALAYAVEKNLERIEVIGPVAPWMFSWTKDRRETVTLQIYPHTTRGTMALLQRPVYKLRQRLG